MLGFARFKSQNQIKTLIGKDTVIHGEIKFSGGLRVDGCVRGDVNETGSPPGILVLSKSARVEGSVNVSSAIIDSTVLGTVTSTVYVELQTHCHVAGGLQYRKMEIHNGAIVEGSLSRLPEEFKMAAKPAPASVTTRTEQPENTPRKMTKNDQDTIEPLLAYADPDSLDLLSPELIRKGGLKQRA